MELDGVEILGFVAAVFTTSGFLPQVIKTWRTKNVNALSLTMYLVLFTGMFLWLVYGIYKNSLALIASNVVSCGLTLSLIIFILKYKKKTPY
ncbi:MAG: SemiSWEET transporter [Bacteroidota bacterium]